MSALTRGLFNAHCFRSLVRVAGAAVVGVALLVVADATPSQAAKRAIDPFAREYRTGSDGVGGGHGNPVEQFRHLIRYSLDKIHPAWLVSAGAGRDQDELRRLNDHINAIPYRREWSDIWWSPEMLLKSGGDCEDQAIAKYTTLRRAGRAASDLMILVVEELGRRELHAVLAVANTAGNAILILDNREAKPYRLSVRGDLRLLFGLNETGLWRYNSKRRNGMVLSFEPKFDTNAIWDMTHRRTPRRDPKIGRTSVERSEATRRRDRTRSRLVSTAEP